MTAMSIDDLRARRDELRARLVWSKDDYREYRQIESFLKYAERLGTLFEGAKYEKVRSC